jgi:O-antigen/teichoic acid export membrane protein
MNTDMLSDAFVGRRVIRGGAARGAAFVAANLLTLVGAMVLLRHLGVRDFGRYGTVFALVGVVQGLSDAGLTVTGSRELALAQTDDDRRDVLAHVLGMRIALTGVGVLCAVAFAAAAGYGDELIVGTALAGVGVFLTSLQTAMLLPLSVELRNGTLALNEVLRQGILVVTFVVLAVLGARVVPFLAAQIVVGVGLLCVTPMLLARRHLVAPRWTPGRLGALGRIALPVAFATVLGVLYLRTLVVLMSLLSASERQIGYFVTSTRVLEVAGGIPFLVIAVVLPVATVAARDDHARLRYITSRLTLAMALVGVTVALTLWTLAEPIVRILGGAEYAAAAPVLQIQGFAMITIFLSASWQPAIYGMGRVKGLAAALAVGLAAVILGGFALIPSHAAIGGAWAVVIGDVAVCIATYVVLRGGGQAGWVPMAGLLRIAVAGCLGVAAGLVPTSDVVSALLALAVFWVVAIALRTVPSELLDAVAGIYRRGRSRAAAE